jgi:hypothetical protein
LGELLAQPRDGVGAINCGGYAAGDFNGVGEAFETVELVGPEELAEREGTVLGRGIDGVEVAAAGGFPA